MLQTTILGRETRCTVRANRPPCFERDFRLRSDSLRTFLSFGIVWNFKPGEFRQLLEQLGTQQLYFTMMRTINKAGLSKRPAKRSQNAKRFVNCYQFPAQL